MSDKDKKVEKPVNKLIVLEGHAGDLRAFATELTTLTSVRADNRRLSVVVNPETLEVSEKDEENG